MESNFNKPQRQSSVGILVLFVDSLQKIARAFFPIILIVFFKSESISKLYVVLSLVLILLITAVIAYLKYINFTFYIDDENDEFIIQEGIFNKSVTTIQLNKIQQVNINQSFFQRLVNVFAVDVDTAGSDNKEGNIKAISHKLALELKVRLLENSKSTTILDTQTKAIEEESEKQSFLKINVLSLIKVGITSNYVKSIGLLLTFFFTIQENLKNIGKDDLINEKAIDGFVEKNSAVYSVLVFVIAMFSVIFIINIVRTLVKYFNYTVAKQKGSLLLSYGLISTKSTIVKPEKVQIVTITRNYFQKKLNVLEIKIKQAVRDEKQHSKSQIEIPGCNEIEKDEILQLIFQQLPHGGEMIIPNFRKLVFSIFLVIVVPVSTFFIFGKYINAKALDYSSMVVIYVVFFLTILFFGFRNYRLFVNEDSVIKKSGAWDIDHEIIKIDKIQAVSTSQLFWHKRLNIGSLTLHTAAGNVTFQLGNYKIINNYVNNWLYKIETSNSNWM